MTKTYPIVQLGEYLYALDKEAEIKEEDWFYSPLVGGIVQHNVSIRGEDDTKIIATSNPSLGIYLLPETEEDFWENMPVRWIKWTKRKPHWNGSVWMQFNGKNQSRGLVHKGELYKLEGLANSEFKNYEDTFYWLEQDFEYYKAAREKGKYSEEDMLFAAKYGYDFHKETQFSSGGFEEVCKNNFLQALESLSPAPIKVEIEMEDVLDHMDMKIGEEPKTKDNVVIGRYIYE